MITASTCRPSCRRTSSLVVVPSAERWHASRLLVARTKRCSRTASAALGSIGTSAHAASVCRSRCLRLECSCQGQRRLNTSEKSCPLLLGFAAGVCAPELCELLWHLTAPKCSRVQQQVPAPDIRCRQVHQLIAYYHKRCQAACRLHSGQLWGEQACL